MKNIAENLVFATEPLRNRLTYRDTDHQPPTLASNPDKEEKIVEDYEMHLSSRQVHFVVLDDLLFFVRVLVSVDYTDHSCSIGASGSEIQRTHP